MNLFTSTLQDTNVSAGDYMELTSSMPPPQIETSASGEDLASKTVLLRVRFGLMGNSRKISNSAVQVDADKNLIRVSKKLLESEELDAIRKADGELRGYIYDTCLPGFDDGLYFLPDLLIDQVEATFKKFKTERETLVDVFIAAYPELCKKAEESLRAVYSSKDYPSAEDVRAKFTFSWNYMEFGVPGKLRRTNPALFAQEREKLADTFRDAEEQVIQVMRATLAEMVEKLRERLTDDGGKQKIFRDTAVTNLQEFLNSFDFRNVTNDTDLKAQVDRARALITGTDPQALRDMDGLRNRVREGMAAISQALEPLVMDKPSRKFRPELEQ